MTARKPHTDPAAQCEGKHRFDNGGLARQVAKAQSKRHDAGMKAYPCDHCGGWHVGSTAHRRPVRKNK